MYAAIAFFFSRTNVSWTYIYFDLNILWTELNWTMVAWPTALKLGQFVNLAILLPMDSNPFKYSGTNVPKIFLNDCFLYPTIFDDLRKVGQFRHLLKLRNNWTDIFFSIIQIRITKIQSQFRALLIFEKCTILKWIKNLCDFTFLIYSWNYLST